MGGGESERNVQKMLPVAKSICESSLSSSQPNPSHGGLSALSVLSRFNVLVSSTLYYNLYQFTMIVSP